MLKEKPKLDIKKYEDQIASLNGQIATLENENDSLMIESAVLFNQVQQYNSAIDSLNQVLDDIQEEIEQTQIVIEAKKVLNETNKNGTDSYLKALTSINESTKDAITITKTFGETIEGKLTNAFVDFFDITNKKFLEFKNLAMSVTQAVIRELVEVYVLNQL